MGSWLEVPGVWSVDLSSGLWVEEKKSRMAVVEPNLDLEKEVDKASAHTEPHISTGIYF